MSVRSSQLKPSSIHACMLAGMPTWHTRGRNDGPPFLGFARFPEEPSVYVTIPSIKQATNVWLVVLVVLSAARASESGWALQQQP